MPLPVPPHLDDDPAKPLRYYSFAEVAQIGLERRGVSGDGDHAIEEMAPSGNGVVRRYFCKWEERYAAAVVLVGACASYLDTVAVPTQDRISRLLPDTYGIVSGQQWTCTRVRFSPFRFLGTVTPIAEGQDAPDFWKCEIAATYEQVPYDLKEDADTAIGAEVSRYVTKPGFPGAEISTDTSYIGLPGGTLKYVTAGGLGVPAGIPVPYPFGFVENYRNLTYIFRRVPFDLWGVGTALHERVIGDGTHANRGMIGSLNKTTFDLRGPLTLQLRSVEEQLLLDPLGIGYSWDLKYKMSEKLVPFGHLGFAYHPAGGAGGTGGYYETLRSTTAGNAEIAAGALTNTDALFPLSEFADLFQFFA